MRTFRTGIWTSTSLEPALIRLSAADEMQEFWEASKALLHLALPIHFCCLCFRPFIVMPATVFRERAPFANDAEFQRFRELCPFSSYVEHHLGVRVIRLSDIIDTARLVKTEFFRLFMRPCGDRYQTYLVLWESGIFQGLIGLHRTAQQRDFPLRGIWQGETRLYFDQVILMTVLDFRRQGSARSLKQLKTNLLREFDQLEILITESPLRVH